MMKTVASLFALYVSTTYSQIPPIPPPQPAIPAVTAPPQPPQLPVPPQTTISTTQTTIANPVTPPEPPQLPPNVVIPPQPGTVASVPPRTPRPTVERISSTQSTAPAAVIPPPSAPNAPFVPVTPSSTSAATTSTTAAPIATEPLTPPGKYFGFYGHLCPIPEPDAMCQPSPDLSFGKDVTEQVVGFAKCERNGDCCGCKSISCGNEWNGCNTFSAGNYGAMGVQSINIIGRSEQNGGGQIQCLGIEACANSVITGSRIKSIDADKAGSMRNAQVTLSSVVADFDLNCIGIGSCEGMKLEINIAGPPPGFMCNPALSGGLIEWASMSCYGQDSCRNMEIVVNNNGCHRIEIQQIECYSPTACANTKFELNGDVSVNNCDLLGSSAGYTTGLARVCGLGGGYTPGAPGTVPVQWIPV